MNPFARFLLKFTSAAFLFAILYGVASAATNIVVNGDFEAGVSESPTPPAGWALSANPSVFMDAVAGFGEASSIGFHAGPVGVVNFLSQTLTTIPGETYVLTYSLRNELGGTNSFQVSWGGIDVGTSFLDSSAFAYTQFSLPLVAPSASTTLSFGFRNDPSFWDLDNVSVVTSSGSVGVPDGGAPVLMLSAAILTLAFLRRRFA